MIDTLYEIVNENRVDHFNQDERKELTTRIKKMGVYIELIGKAYLDTTLLLKYDQDYETIQDYNNEMEQKPLIIKLNLASNKIKDILETLDRE